MKAQSFFVLAVSCCVLSLSYWFFTKNKNGNEKPESFINPPLKGVDVAFTNYIINPAKDTVITCASGSQIKIPAQAFVDSKGQIVKGPITLKFREFKDAVDIFVSGIPMTYDSLGKEYQFESAGMFEILAYKNKEAVFVNATAPIIVDMASDQTENRFNNYYLDTIKKNWQYIAENRQVTDSKSADEKATKQPPAKPSNLPIIAPVKSNSKNVFDIAFDNNEFPELAGYEGIKFEVAADEKNYDPKLANKIWESVKIEKHQDDLTYVITFIENSETHSFKVKPVFEGTDYAKATKKYEQLLADYNKQVTEKTTIEKTKQKLRDSLYTAQRSDVDNINKYGSITASEQAARFKTEGDIMRVFTIRKFGIWNSDCPSSLPEGQPRFAYFRDKGNNKLVFDHVYLIEKGKKALYNYYAERLKKFQFDSKAKNTIIAVTKDNQVALFSIADFEKLNNTKRRPHNDTISFADSDSVRFMMKVHVMPIKNAETLKSLINI